MLYNMARTSRAIADLSDEYQLETCLLCRVLFEHCVKFCWIAVEPGKHYTAWLQTDVAERSKSIRDGSRIGLDQLPSILPSPKLGDREIPPLAEMCVEVDRYWGQKLEEFSPSGPTSTRALYVILYRYFSSMTHGNGMGLQQAIVESESGWVVGTGDATSRGLTLAPILLAQALLAAAEHGFHVDREAVHAVFDSESALSEAHPRPDAPS